MPNGYNSDNQKNKPKTRKRKAISNQEKQFAKLMVYENMGCIQAARVAFKWPCEPNSSTAQKAINLNRAKRIVAYKLKLQQELDREVTAQQVLSNTTDVEFDSMRQFIYRRLEAIRDDSKAPGSSRFKAMAALEKMVDPAADINLILMWVDMVWRAASAHCPCCHKTYPLKRIINKKLNKWRGEMEIDPQEEAQTLFERRMTILSRADNRKKPHPGQVKALSAPERNIAGLGPAQSGKSFLLAAFALLTFMIPGVEVWILARTYADAAYEVEYLDKFLNTLFFPYTKHIITRKYDNKSDELSLESKWNSAIKIKSAMAKGSIIGRALELAAVAEPGWIPDDNFNHLRARMTSRLGRTVLLGTPQGFGGMLGRFVNMVGKDSRGRPRRIPASERTIEAGCPWNISLLKFEMRAEDNPEYVSSELAAARQELTDAEYASEFQGLMASAEGAVFPQLAERHLTAIPRSVYENCVWVLGVDQGPKNFAAVLLGYDGQRVYVANEFFDNDSRTMKYKLDILRETTPAWIRKAGGDPKSWKLTIYDVDPPLLNELEEFEDEGRPWPTEYTFRVKDKRGRWNQENWRKETYEYVNALAMPSPPNLYFDGGNCDFLHDQLVRAQVRPDTSSGEGGLKMKGWIIQDAMRGDHVPDAFIMGMFSILSGQLILPDREFRVDDPYEDARKAFMYKLARDEDAELSGFEGRNPNSDEQFERIFGRKRNSNPRFAQRNWNYEDY